MSHSIELPIEEEIRRLKKALIGDTSNKQLLKKKTSFAKLSIYTNKKHNQSKLEIKPDPTDDPISKASASKNIQRLVQLLTIYKEQADPLILLLEAIVAVLIEKKNYLNLFIDSDLLFNLSYFVVSPIDYVRIFSCQIISLVSKEQEKIDCIYTSQLVRPLVELLQDESNEIVLQSIFVISNILKNGNEQHQHLLIQIGAISSIVLLLSKDNELIVKFAIQALASLGYGNVFQKQCLIDSGALQSIAPFITNNNDNDDTILIESLKLLVNVAKGTDEQKQTIINLGFLDPILVLFESSNEVVLRKTIQLIQNLASGSLELKQALLDYDFARHILAFINYNSSIIRLYALECISNLSKGKNSQKKKLVENSILPVIKNTVVLSKDKILQKQVLQIVQNFSEGNDFLKLSLVNSNILQTMMPLLMVDTVPSKNLLKSIVTNTASSSPLASPTTGNIPNSIVKVRTAPQIIKNDDPVLLKPSETVKKRVMKIYENMSRSKNRAHIQYLINLGLVNEIPTIMKISGSSIKKHCLLILSNICKYDINSKQIVIDSGILSYLKKYLVSSSEYFNQEIINAIFQILIGISEGNIEQKQAIIDLGFINVFLPLLNNVNETITTLSLRVIANVVQGTDEQKQYIIRTGILSSLPPLMFSLNEVIKRISIEILQWIANGNEANKQDIIDIGSIELVKPLLIKDESDLETKRIILNLILNLSEGSDDQVKSLVYSGIFKLLYPLVKLKDNSLIKLLVCCVENVIFQFCYVKNFVRISLPIIFTGFQLLEDDITIHCLSAVSNMTFSVEGQTEVIQYGLLQLVKYLVSSQNDAIKHEVVKILINISAGDASKKQALINLNLSEVFEPLFQSQNEQIINDTVWALKNLTDKSTEKQKILILESKILLNLIPIIEVSAPLQPTENNFKKNTIVKKQGIVKNIFSANSNVPYNKVPREYTTKSIESFSTFATTPDQFHKKSQNFKQQLQQNEADGNNAKKTTALKLRAIAVFTNLAESSNSGFIKQRIIDMSVASVVKLLLVIFTDNLIKREAMKLVLHLSLGTDQQKQYLIDMGYIDILVPLLIFGDSAIKKLTTMTLYYLSALLDDEHRAYLIESGVEELLAPLNENKDIRRFSHAAIENLRAPSVPQQTLNHKRSFYN